MDTVVEEVGESDWVVTIITRTATRLVRIHTVVVPGSPMTTPITISGTVTAVITIMGMMDTTGATMGIMAATDTTVGMADIIDSGTRGQDRSNERRQGYDSISKPITNPRQTG